MFQKIIITNATHSEHEKKNLSIGKNIKQDIQRKKLISAIGWEYLSIKTPKDGKYDVIKNHTSIQYIYSPSEELFPGMY